MKLPVSVVVLLHYLYCIENVNGQSSWGKVRDVGFVMKLGQIYLNHGFCKPVNMPKIS